MSMMIRAMMLILTMALTLSACGGGGNGGNDANGTPALSSDASLTDMSISAAPLDQVFDSKILSYSATVDFLSSTVTVSAISSHPDATIRIGESIVASGAPSNPISLDEGQNQILVRVTAEDGVTERSYQIVITRLTGSAFEQQAYIKASDAGPLQYFGVSIAISGETLAVGSFSEAVYIFERDGAGMWSQQDRLTVSSSDPGDSLGHDFSIALEGNTLVVGAAGEDSAATGVNGLDTDNSANNAGAAYVFVRDETGQWSQQAYLKASNTEANDQFGRGVAISGDTIAVSAMGEDGGAAGINGDESSNLAPLSGAIYVFTRDGTGTWSQQAYIKASNPEAGDRIHRVALDGNTLVVGAAWEDSASTGVDGAQDDNGAEDSGAVYIFRRSGVTWSQEAYIKASDTSSGSLFGQSVSVDGASLAVGAGRASGGKVYVFGREDTGSWSQTALLEAAYSDPGDYFGYSVALSGEVLAVGAVEEDSASIGINGNQLDNSANRAGAAYVFDRNAPGNWSQNAYLKASNNGVGTGEQFGHYVAISGNTVVVSATFEDGASTGINGDQESAGAQDSGAVYVFQ